MRRFLNPDEDFKLVKEVLLQEFMNLVVVTEANVAPLKMVNPVAARILKLHRQISLYPVARGLADLAPGSCRPHISLLRFLATY